jgi:hypothetical protein
MTRIGGVTDFMRVSASDEGPVTPAQPAAGGTGV